MMCSSGTAKGDYATRRPGETKIRISSSPEMVYYHPFESCTNLTAGDVREVKLIIAHTVMLRKFSAVCISVFFLKNSG